MSDEHALVPAEAPQLPTPVFSAQQMAGALSAYKALQRTLDEQMPDAIMSLDGKNYRKKAYWRAVATAFNLTVELVREEQVDVAGDWGYLVTYRATAGTRITDGDGSCMASEKARGRMRATVHNVRSHAHTRAFNRAVSNLVGFGEVSAEEVVRQEHEAERTDVVEAEPEGFMDEPAPRKSVAPAATPDKAREYEPGEAQYVERIEQKTGTNQKTKKAWVMYGIVFKGSRSPVWTFDEAKALLADKCRMQGVPIRPRIQKDTKYNSWNLIDFAVVGQLQDDREPGSDDEPRIF